MKHGLSYMPEYRAWQTMRQRCTVPENPAYEDYGGRGITICDRWLNSPQAFIDDMGLKPTPAHELDRIENDGGYEPNNCRWVLRKTNCRNRRSNRRLEHAGEILCLAEWSERSGVPRDTLRKRLEAGWDISRAITASVGSTGPKRKLAA